MTPTVRTLIFVAAALASVGIAAGVHLSTKPVELDAFSDVGDEFYPEFTDPAEATALQVAAYDEESGRTDVFKVEFRDGRWRIPSHHNYPADGESQLARTAASMIGVPRQALVERSANAHKRYGVLDPLDEDVVGTEGRGDRITLLKGDEVLVDYIVGNRVDGAGNTYYVRRADEDRIYLADLGNLAITTRFTDWIEKDLLEAPSQDVKEVIIDRYTVNESTGRFDSEGTVELKRNSDTNAWQLTGLNDETEKLQTSQITSMLSALNQLEIVGVRRKPPELAAGLRGDRPLSVNQLTQLDLQARGFYIAGGQFVASEGEMAVGLKNGILYDLRFGKEFTGTEVELEVGKDAPADGEAQAADEVDSDSTDSEESSDEATDDVTEEAEVVEEGEDSSGSKSTAGRYVFITVHFDEKLLGPVPVQPVKPEPPADEPADADVSESEEATAADEPTSEGETTGEPDAAGRPADAQPSYQEQLQKYEDELAVYEIRKKEYDKTREEAEKKVEELNARFADWYYVISEDQYDRLKLSREELVEPRAKEDQAGTAPGSPVLPSPDSASPSVDAPDANADTADDATESSPSAENEGAAAASDQTDSANDESSVTPATVSASDEGTPPADAGDASPPASTETDTSAGDGTPGAN